VVRFARLIHRPVRVLGGPSVRAACGVKLSLAWLPLKVVPHGTGRLNRSTARTVSHGEFRPAQAALLGRTELVTCLAPLGNLDEAAPITFCDQPLRNS
jgi:hypothetical protein